MDMSNILFTVREHEARAKSKIIYEWVQKITLRTRIAFID